jgi:adenylate kinase
VRKRLSVYHEQTSPLVQFYTDMQGPTAPRYARVAGVGSVEQIRERVLAALEA